jgi:hypothetical protein
MTRVGEEMIMGVRTGSVGYLTGNESVGVPTMANSQDVDFVSLDIVAYPVRPHPPAVLPRLGYDHFAPCVRLLSDPPQRFQNPSLVLGIDLSEVLVEAPGDNEFILPRQQQSLRWGG